MPTCVGFLRIYQGDLEMVSMAQSFAYSGLIGDVVFGLRKIAAPQEVAGRRWWKPHSPIMLGKTAEMIDSFLFLDNLRFSVRIALSSFSM